LSRYSLDLVPTRRRHLTIRIPAATSGTDHRRLITLFAITQTVGFVALIGVFPVLLGPIATGLGVSRPQVALASTISTLVGALAGYPVGRLLDHRGGRLTMTLGSGVGVVGVLVWSQARTLSELYLAFALVGVAQTMSTYDAAFAVIVAAIRSERRDATILTMTMIVGLTTYLASPIMGWLAGWLGWRGTLLVLAVGIALTGVPGHLQAIPPAALHRRRAPQRTGASLAEVLHSSRFWLLALAFTAQTAATTGVLTMLVTYLRDRGFSETAATSIPVAIGVFQIVARFGLSSLGGRVSVALVCVIAYATQAGGMLALPFTGLSLTLALICVSAVGLGNGVGVIARAVLIADGFGTTHFARIMAVTALPMALAKAIAPVTAAWLGNGDFLVLFGSMSALASVALLPIARHARYAPRVRGHGATQSATDARAQRAS